MICPQIDKITKSCLADENTKYHIGLSALGTFGVAFTFHAFMGLEEPEAALIIGALTMTTVGFAKEVIDAGDRNEKLDVGDLGANLLGTVIGGTIFYLIAPEPVRVTPTGIAFRF